MRCRYWPETLIIVAVLGVFRGFFQGMGTMIPSAVSQIIEQIVNAVVSVGAAYVLFAYGRRIATVLGSKEHYDAAYGAAGGAMERAQVHCVDWPLSSLCFQCFYRNFVRQ